jgi:hypothetical protein
MGVRVPACNGAFDCVARSAKLPHRRHERHEGHHDPERHENRERRKPTPRMQRTAEPNTDPSALGSTFDGVDHQEDDEQQEHEHEGDNDREKHGLARVGARFGDDSGELAQQELGPDR